MTHTDRTANFVHFYLKIEISITETLPCVRDRDLVANLVSQSACVFRQKYRTEKYLLHHKVMLPHPF
jgi:hypothetical protein